MLPLVTGVISLEFLSWIIITSCASTNKSLTSMSEVKRIPSDGMDWITLREQNYLYSDKTTYLEYMLSKKFQDKFLIMHRPRGFGKSSFLKMAECFVRGNESLFQGLKINDQGNREFFYNPRHYWCRPLSAEVEWTECPVIHLDFGAITHFETMDQFENSFYQQLKNIGQSFNLRYSETDSKIDINSLMGKLLAEHNCNIPILIDEYDAPFRQALYRNNNPELAEKIRIFINTLLNEVTDTSRNYHSSTKLVLVLGNSKLQMDSLKYVYNDLTFNEQYGGAFGFTNEDIENFYPEISHKFNLKNREEFDKFIDGLRKTYEGHNFAFRNSSKDVNVWNPVSIVKYLNEKTFTHCISTDFMIKEIVRKIHFSEVPLQRFENLEVSKKEIERGRNPVLQGIPIEILMFENGYLTISTYNEKTKSVTLKFSSKEIKTMLESEVQKYSPLKEDYILSKSACTRELKWYLLVGHVIGVMDTLKCMFKTINQEIHGGFDVTKKFVEFIRLTEISYSESVKIQKDNSSLANEADVVDVLTQFYATSFVFKIDHSAILAIEKLIQYLDLYSDSFLKAIGNPKELFLVGMNFTAKVGGHLDQWITVPWKNGNLMCDQVKALSEGSIQEFNRKVKTCDN